MQTKVYQAFFSANTIAFIFRGRWKCVQLCRSMSHCACVSNLSNVLAVNELRLFISAKIISNYCNFLFGVRLKLKEKLTVIFPCVVKMGYALKYA